MMAALPLQPRRCWLASLLGLLPALVPVAAQDKVPVDLYYETGCPFSIAAIKGPLHQLLDAGFVDGVMNLNLHPFGNSYFVTSQCGGAGAYTSEARKCFDTSCGAGASSRPSDCFTGEIVCQHGPAECQANFYSVCAKKVALGNRITMLKWAICLAEGYSTDTASLAQSCATSTGLSWDAINTCVSDQAGVVELVKQEALSTPLHDVVPKFNVAGQLLEENAQLLRSICAAYTGPKPAACTNESLQLPSPAPAPTPGRRLQPEGSSSSAAERAAALLI